MLYGCNCASVGVPEDASNRSTAVTPGSASIWLCSVAGGPPISEYAISTWNELGVQLAVAVGVVALDCHMHRNCNRSSHSRRGARTPAR